MKSAFRKLISVAIITGLLLGSLAISPTPAMALTAAGGGDGSGTDGGGPTTGSNSNVPMGTPAPASAPVNAQAAAYSNGITTGQGVAASNQAANVAAKGGACVAGTILANILSSVISLLINKGVGYAQDLLSVPTHSAGHTADNQDLDTSSHSGVSIFGILVLPSWDSVAWCIVNEIISYLIDATIQWAQTGFNGNPAYITNPSAFFKGIADQEAGNFIQGIVKNAIPGLNVCQPFRVQIALNLSSAYGNNLRSGSCSIQSIVKNYQGFVNGSNFSKNGSWPGWFALTQNNANNIYGSYIDLGADLQARLSVKNNTAQLELGWNKGFLSVKHCDKKNADGTADPNSCRTDTPGTLIQSSLEKSLNLPKDRLVFAQKFDQLVTVLVNSLIKVALDKILTPSQSASQGTTISNTTNSQSTPPPVTTPPANTGRGNRNNPSLSTTTSSSTSATSSSSTSVATST